jgi:hypothetical protein
MAFDGTNLWVTDQDRLYVAKLDGTSGKMLGMYGLAMPAGPVPVN